MSNSADINFIGLSDFIINNIQKIVLPEELIKLEMSLSRFELMALMVTDRAKQITMSNLAQGMTVPMSTATGIVDRLVAKGLMERERNENDRRIVTAFLSARGKKTVQEINEHFNTFIGRVKTILTEDEFDTAMVILQKVIVGLQQSSPKSPAVKRKSGRKTIKVE